MESAIEETVHNIPCNICRRQFSRYTCPRCNILYCSLTCFRSTAHSNCSENFYKKELETDIRTTPSKTTEERKQMMELLKRFEEDSLDDSELINELANDEEDDDFASRFGDLDLENISHDQLWSILKPEERERFMKALNDPSSELAQQLLASDELEKQRIEPWWEDNDAKLDERSSIGSSNLVQRKYGVRPGLISIPEAVVSASAKSLDQGPSLLYNIIATLIVYTYITRFFTTSPISSMDPNGSDSHEARQTISQLLPFLIDRKSTTVLPNLSAVITDLWSRLEPEHMTSTFFSILLHDASKLLRPSPVTILPLSISAPASPYESHPNTTTLLALSDLSAFFSASTPLHSSSSSPSNSKPRAANPNTHITHKLAFYAARIISTSTNVLTVLSNELILRAEVVRREGIVKTDGEGESENQKGSRMIELSDPVEKGTQLLKPVGPDEVTRKRVVIEELS